jgi:phospholipid transport system substrate-binding protein
MVKLAKYLFLAGGFALLAAPPVEAADSGTTETAALAKVDPRPVIESFNQTLLSVMKSADQLGYDGRYKRLEPAIKRTFNVPLMTQIVVGSAWNNWSQAQRDQVTDAFGRFIIATYARRFDGYSGEQIIVDGTRDSRGGTLVMTRITRPSDTPVTLNYLMRDNGSGGPQAVDVFLTGTISELATRRSEFGAVLDRDGFNGLIAMLAKKADNQASP